MSDHDEEIRRVLSRVQEAAAKIPGPEFHVIRDGLIEIGSALVDLAFLVAKSGDHPHWTEYSLGNPNCRRRIYRGKALYVIPHEDKWTWHCEDVNWFVRERGFETREAAQVAAERWADGK